MKTAKFTIDTLFLIGIIFFALGVQKVHYSALSSVFMVIGGLSGVASWTISDITQKKNGLFPKSKFLLIFGLITIYSALVFYMANRH